MSSVRVLGMMLVGVGWAAAVQPALVWADEAVEKFGPLVANKTEVALELRYPDPYKSALDVYTVAVTIRRPMKASPLKSEHLDAWVLRKSRLPVGLGLALEIRDFPPAGTLPEKREGEWATIKATYAFKLTTLRKDLVAIVVAIEDEPFLFRVARPKGK